MKKSILIFALLLTSISYSFANPSDDISKRAVSSFNKDFSSAKNIKWERKSYLVKATFTLDDAIMFAYYSTEGELVAVARNISSDQLPIAKLLSLKKNYKDFSIREIVEVQEDSINTYYVAIENENLKLVLESADGGNWHLYSKKRKK